MAGMSIKVNGELIKQPVNPKLSTYNLTKSGRVASGKMVMDLVAKKKKVFLDYEILAGSDLDQLLRLVDGDKMFFQVEYTENGKVNSFTAYVGEISRTLQRGSALSGWYWLDVSLNFIEQ